jgi:uncharacterized protein
MVLNSVQSSGYNATEPPHTERGIDMSRLRWIVGLMLLVIGITGPAHAETLEKVLQAPHSQRVYDYAGVLSAAERVQLRRQMLALEPKHLAQGAIVVVHRVEGQTMERFAQQILNRWGVGEKRRNNGFVILVAIDQRKWRLATGGGLRKKIPDAMASRLMREAVVPSFRHKRYAEGLSAAVTAIRKKLAGERPITAVTTSYAASPSTEQFTPPASTGLPGSIVGIGFVLAALFAFVCVVAGIATSGSRGLSSRTARFNNRHQNHTSHTHTTTHQNHSPPPSNPGGGDYGGGSSSGGGASGSW